MVRASGQTVDRWNVIIQSFDTLFEGVDGWVWSLLLELCWTGRALTRNDVILCLEAVSNLQDASLYILVRRVN